MVKRWSPLCWRCGVLLAADAWCCTNRLWSDRLCRGRCDCVGMFGGVWWVVSRRSFKGNRIGDAGAAAVASALVHLPHLRVLKCVARQGGSRFSGAVGTARRCLGWYWNARGDPLWGTSVVVCVVVVVPRGAVAQPPAEQHW
jgi:hypothetical protein